MTTDTTDISEAPHLVNLSETTVAKEGNVFSVTLHDGSLPLREDHPLGVYADDCRVLSGHELRIGGSRPRPLVTSESTGAALGHELTNPPLALGDGRVLPLQTLRIRIERTLDGAGFRIVPRLQKPAFGVGAHSRLGHLSSLVVQRVASRGREQAGASPLARRHRPS